MGLLKILLSVVLITSSFSPYALSETNSVNVSSTLTSLNMVSNETNSSVVSDESEEKSVSIYESKDHTSYGNDQIQNSLASVTSNSTLTSNSLDSSQANSWRFSDGLPAQNQLEGTNEATLKDDAILNANTNAIAKGIDVSEWQGNIDWQAVKNSGKVDFAIIRCGYGSNSTNRDDKKWSRNVSECERLGIPYGVYIYSHATSWADLNSEVQHTLRLIKGHGPTYPVFIDMEDSKTTSVGRSTLTSFAKSYCDQIENAGYVAGVYANTNWFTNVLYGDQLDSCVKWVAQYNTVCTYTGRYSMWQYSSKGKISGISGNVDLDYQYFDVRTSESPYQGIYDYDYYVESNADVRRVFGGDRVNTFKHFLEYGMNEGRQGSALFDLEFYKTSNPDLVKIFGTNNRQYYMHFLNNGMNEGRKGSVIFDLDTYKSSYADLIAAFGSDNMKYYSHFQEYGMSEGRCASVMFDLEAYKIHNSDCCKAFATNNKSYYTHFFNYGMKEGRKASEIFDIAYYKSNNDDVSKEYGNDNVKYYYHFFSSGMNEGEKSSDMFDLTYYKSNNADCAKSFKDDNEQYYKHFFMYGMNEGRHATSDFNVGAYYNRYVDLRKAYSTNLRLYYSHYSEYGKKEGREHLVCDSLKSPITSLGGVDYSLVYNTSSYINKYADLKKVYTFSDSNHLIDDQGLLLHFIDYGMSEGRQAISTFDVHAYKSKYLDLQHAFGNNLKGYYLHYITYGKKEGRKCVWSEVLAN